MYIEISQPMDMVAELILPVTGSINGRDILCAALESVHVLYPTMYLKYKIEIA